MEAEREPPEDIDEFLDRHREALERKASSNSPASWVVNSVLDAADPEDREREEDDER